MACLPSSIVRSDGRVDRRSLGIFTSGLLAEFYGGVDFVCRLAIFPVPSCAHQRAIPHECVHGTHQFAVLSSSVFGGIFRQYACRAMGDVRGDAFVHAGTSYSFRLEPSRLVCIWIRTFPWLVGQSFLGAMVCACSAVVVGLSKHCWYVGICDACSLVVETHRCRVHLACA